MRVLVVRPEPEAQATARRLEALGHVAVVAPLSEIVAVQAIAPAGPFDAIAVTSANAVRHGAAVLTPFRFCPAWCVGTHTAAAAHAAGLTVAGVADNAVALVALIARSGTRHVLYPCGAVRRPDLETGLGAAGIAVQAVVTYANRDRMPDAKGIAALAPVDAVLLHAPSAAARLVAWQGSARLVADAAFICMSQAVRDALPDAMHRRCVVAARPNEASLLDALGLAAPGRDA